MHNAFYVSIHSHCEFSQLDGMGHVKDWVAKAKELGCRSLAISDHGNVDCAIELTDECLKQGINPIVGCLLKGQLIVTNNGVKPIEEIVPGDIVLTHKGKFQKVLRNMKRFYKGRLFDIELSNNKGHIILTEEHPILIRDRQNFKSWRRPVNIEFGRHSKLGGIHCWKNWACFPKIHSQRSNQDIDVIKYLPSNFCEVGSRVFKKRKHKYDRDILWNFPTKLKL